MKHLSRFFNILLIVLLIALFVVPAALAQDGSGGDVPSTLLAPFAPILAASLAVERILQFIRNLLSPDPESGLLARGSNALRYYATGGGVILGLLMAFMSDNLRLLALAGINIDPTIDALLTGITLGMGSEVVHQIVQLLAEGKYALRSSTAAREQAINNTEPAG